MSGKHHRGVRVALEGCGHGKLNDIYTKVAENAAAKGWDGVDLVIIGGDFQSVRNTHDLSGMSVPIKYREIGDFHEYYSGKRTAPYLTIFIGGNHEASNYLFELYYGGWVAPNIYYVGAANILRFGPLRIAGLSGIFKGYDYNKQHFERIPYNSDDVKTIYHVRELDVRKLLQVRTQVDIGLSHDWPKGIEWSGNYNYLFKAKRGFREDAESGTLGSVAARHVLDRLRPPHWFSAHLHVRYIASVFHGDYTHPRASSKTNSHNPNSQQSFDGPSDLAPSLETSKNDLPPQINAPKDALTAWNNFSEVAAKQALEENEKFIQERDQDEGPQLLDLQSITSTWRQIKEDDPDRAVISIQRSNSTGEDIVVKNADEIDLDMDSESDDGGITNVVWKHNSAKPDKMDVDSEVNVVKTDGSQPPQAIEQVHKESGEEDSEKVSEDIREQLPEAFKRPQHEQAVYGPLPDEIWNKQTQFLALGKCQEQRACHDYLELMEIFPTTDENRIQSPYNLQYDKEWLAITRAFAHMLTVGEHKSQVPSDLGDEKYKELIAAEEDWVQQNIVDQNKMAVPQNFEITAPVYDPAVPIDTTDMPAEYNNPQTAAFCELLGIENKFYLSPMEREQRMVDGPRPTLDLHTTRGGNRRWSPHQGRTRGHSYGRGGRGRGGRGRGGHRYQLG